MKRLRLIEINKLDENLNSVKSHNPRLDGGQACKSVVQTSYDIVKAHGGEIKVELKEGKGSKFILQIPIL
jgi:signal transduction histidine kinase